jgi:hypothetical protein
MAQPGYQVRHRAQSRRAHPLGFRLPPLLVRRSLILRTHNVVLLVETTRSIMGEGSSDILAKDAPFSCRYGTCAYTPAIVVCPIAVYT